MITFSCFYFPQEAIESGQTPPKSGGFSFKGLSSMLFGAESPEVLETKITYLEEQIHDAEEMVTKTKEELRSKSSLIIIEIKKDCVFKGSKNTIEHKTVNGLKPGVIISVFL